MKTKRPTKICPARVTIGASRFVALCQISLALLGPVLFCVSPAAAEDAVTGTFDVTLEGSGNTSLVIGQLEISDDGHEFEPDENLFTNHFLSMRPFRCFNQDKVMWCYLPYPYEKPTKVTAKDMRSLEYDLLFIHRSANDYGIDAWNGLYFKVDSVEQGGSSVGDIVGELREVDLNILASPPENGIVWPITEEDLHVDESDRHVFNKVRLSRDMSK